MSHCHTCKFSTWERTKTGRISKSLSGRCVWSKSIQTPTSGTLQGNEVTLRGGAIWHKDNVKCKTYIKEQKP